MFGNTIYWYSQFSQHQQKRAEKRKRRKMIVSSPCLWCLWLIFQRFSAIQLCLQTWGSVEKNPNAHIHTYNIMLARGLCVGNASALFHSTKKVWDRQVDMKLGKYWWLFDHFISHPQTAFCKWRACLCFRNIDFLPTLYSSLFSPNLIWNLKHYRPQDVVCILRSSWLSCGRNTDL